MMLFKKIFFDLRVAKDGMWTITKNDTVATEVFAIQTLKSEDNSNALSIIIGKFCFSISIIK